MINAAPDVYKETIESINTILKRPRIRRSPVNVYTIDDVLMCTKNINSETITPIFRVSSVSGEGMNLVKSFMNLYQSIPNKNKNNNTELYIDSIFKVNGVGTVVGGYLVSGQVSIGDKLLIGPVNEKYTQVIVKSIHCKRVSVNTIKCGSYTCFSFKKLDKNIVRKGLVIISKNSEQIICRKFKAQITVLKAHSTTIRIGYQPIIHSSCIRQSAQLTKILEKTCARGNKTEDNEQVLRTGDKGIVEFNFCFREEYLKEGSTIILCEGMTRLVGEVIEVLK